MVRRKNEDALRGLARILSRGHFMTAAQISEEMGCAKAIAYGRLRALQKIGIELQKQRVREASSGPEAVGYAIIPCKTSNLFIAPAKKKRRAKN